MADARYRIIEKIGEGGMAEVFRAETRDSSGQPATVVLKRILTHLAEDEEYRTMFIDEARIASTLDHRNIVRLLDLGRDEEGRIFLVLEHVDGADLRVLQTRTEEIGAPLSLASILFVVREVLRALEYAHTHHEPDGRLNPIVHRDVSPQNVMVSRAGEVKLLDGRSDVYQAGLLLLVLACGKHPFENETLSALVERAQAGRVPRLLDLRPDMPPFLDELIAGATLLDPARRFPTAGAFARFIETWASRERIRLDTRALARDLEWAFSDPAALTATYSAAGRPVVIADSIGPRSEVSLAPLEAPQREPGTLGDFMLALAPIQEALHPNAEEEITHTFLSMNALEAPPPNPAELDTEVPESSGGATMRSDHASEDLDGSTAVSAAQLPPETDGGTVVSRAALPPEPEREPEEEEESTALSPVQAPPPRAPQVPTAVDAAPTAVLPAHRGAVRALCVAAGAPRAVSAGDDGWLRIWDLAAGTLAAERRAHAAGVTACAIRADGGVALTAGHDRRVVLWDLAGDPEGGALGGQAGVTLALALSPDGGFAIAGGEDGKIRLWDLSKRRVTGTASGHAGPILSLLFFPDRLRFASSSMDRSMRIWSVESADEIATFEDESPARVMALTADNGILLVGRDDGALSMWSPDSGQRLQVAPGHRAAITAIGLAPDGARAITGAADGTICWWDVGRSAVVRQHPAHAGAVTAVAIAPDGEHALSAGEDGTIKGW